MLSNAYLLAKIGADTAENEQHCAEILPTDALRGYRQELEGQEAQGPLGRAPRPEGGAGPLDPCGSAHRGPLLEG